MSWRGGGGQSGPDDSRYGAGRNAMGGFSRDGRGHSSMGDRGGGGRVNVDVEDEEDGHQAEDGDFKMPDRDFHRKKIHSFQTVHAYFEARLHERSHRDRRLFQPHFNYYKKRLTPYYSAMKGDASDGICSHFLRKGFTKPQKTHFHCALWSNDGKWLVLGRNSSLPLFSQITILTLLSLL